MDQNIEKKRIENLNQILSQKFLFSGHIEDLYVSSLPRFLLRAIINTCHL